jgi:hypothetical protein
MIVAEQFIAWNTGKMDPSRRYGVTGCRCESGKFHQAHNSETQKRSQGGPGESSKGYPSYRPLRNGHSQRDPSNELPDYGHGLTKGGR